MPSVVSADCSVGAAGPTFKETIKFADYRFLAELPADVFGSGAP